MSDITSVTNQQTRLHQENAPLASLTVILSHWTHHGTPSERTEIAIQNIQLWTIIYLTVIARSHQCTVVTWYGVNQVGPGPATGNFCVVIFLDCSRNAWRYREKTECYVHGRSAISHPGTEHTRGKVIWSEVVSVFKSWDRTCYFYAKKVIGHDTRYRPLSAVRLKATVWNLFSLHPTECCCVRGSG